MRTNQIIVLVGMIFAMITANAQEILPINFSPEGHWLINATINSVDGNFILDTGGGITILTHSFASKLKTLSKQDGGFTGFRATGERLDLDLYKVEEFKIGKYAIKLTTVTVVDANLGGLDGLISLPEFLMQPFTIDYVSKTLILESDKSLLQRKKQGTVLPIQIANDRNTAVSIFAYFTLNQKLNLQLMLDSGAGNNVFKFNSRFLQRLEIDTTDQSQVTTIYKRSEFNPAIQSVIFKTKVELLNCTSKPSVKFENFKAWFVEGLIYDGVISLNWLGNFITFDLSRHEIILNNN